MKYQHQVQQQIHSTADTHDLRCTVCHGVFSSRGDLDSHMLTHTQQKLASPNNVKHKVSELEPPFNDSHILDIKGQLYQVGFIWLIAGCLQVQTLW